MTFWDGFFATIGHILVAGAVAWYFWSYRKRELVGGFPGGVIAGFIGAILVDFLLSDIISAVLHWLLQPKFVDLNLIASVLGAFLFLYVINRINNDRIRKDY